MWKENENGSRFLLGSIILSFPPDWLWFHSNPPASEQAPLKGSPLGTGLAVWAVSHSISTHLNHVTSAPGGQTAHWFLSKYWQVTGVIPGALVFLSLPKDSVSDVFTRRDFEFT